MTSRLRRAGRVGAIQVCAPIGGHQQHPVLQGQAPRSAFANRVCTLTAQGGHQLGEVGRAQSPKRGYPGRFRRRDHTSHGQDHHMCMGGSASLGHGGRAPPLRMTLSLNERRLLRRVSRWWRGSVWSSAVEVAQQRHLSPVVQQFLVDPPHDVEERLVRVTAVRVGAIPHGVQCGVVDAQ